MGKYMIGTGYIALVPKTTQQWIDEREKKKNKERRVRAKNVTANEKPYVHRLGYHSVVSNYTGGKTVSRLSGSSINRKLYESEKDQKEAIGKTKKDAIKRAK